jgi:hypothetical protein
MDKVQHIIITVGWEQFCYYLGLAIAFIFISCDLLFKYIDKK